MNDFNIGNEVEFFNTSDETLDGERGVIVGRYSNSFIVMFSGRPPAGYYPAIVISGYCLKMIS
ncbi:MAG: hypothetical protein KC589_06950 [Nanoarchaeota archaeon]|nr:hypothetical protein [Nanoarchaeota archaeon]